jgi:hypothetical protein
MALVCIADSIIGLYPIESKPKIVLPHNTTKKVVDMHEKLRQSNENYRSPGIPTTVAFGDASFNSSMKGHPPTPLKVLDLNVTSEFILIVDDYLGTAKGNCKKKSIGCSSRRV